MSTISAHIRPGVAAEFPTLADLWRRSVAATHTFLPEAVMDELYPEVRDIYLPAVELWVAERNGVPLAFMGLSHNDITRVEMLFVDPDARGSGLGSALLGHARKLHGRLAVDVNEQNESARGFYLSQGFTVTGRSELDGQGRPYPLLLLREAEK